MARLNDETKHNYIRKCCESANKHFISENNTVNVNGLIIGGSGLLKNKLHESNLLNKNLRDIVLSNGVLKLHCGSNKNGFNEAIQQCSNNSYFSNYGLSEESLLLNSYFDSIKMAASGNGHNNNNGDTTKCCFGIKDTLFLLRLKMIERLILFKNISIHVITLKNRNNSVNQNLQLFLTDGEFKTNKLLNNANHDGWYISSKMNFMDWILMNGKEFGVKSIVLINEGTLESVEFVNDFGGIGGFLFMAIDLIQLCDNEEERINKLENIYNFNMNNIDKENIGKTIWINNEMPIKPKQKPKMKTQSKPKGKRKDQTNNKANSKPKGKAKAKTKPKKKESVSDALKRFQEFKKRKQEMEQNKNRYVFSSQSTSMASTPTATTA